MTDLSSFFNSLSKKKVNTTPEIKPEVIPEKIPDSLPDNKLISESNTESIKESTNKEIEIEDRSKEIDKETQEIKAIKTNIKLFPKLEVNKLQVQVKELKLDVEKDKLSDNPSITEDNIEKVKQECVDMIQSIGELKSYPDFWNLRIPSIQEILQNNSKENAYLIIYQRLQIMSKILFGHNAARHVYHDALKTLEKEIESTVVAQLIKEEGIEYKPIASPASKKAWPKTSNASAAQNAREALSKLGEIKTKDGKTISTGIDIVKIIANLKWGKSKDDLVKESEKKDYKQNLADLAKDIASGIKNKE